MTTTAQLEIVPLGGLGEFGMNLMVYRWGEDCLVVDAGMMFPAGHLPGVDSVLPDVSFLERGAGRLQGIVLTHAHEDHLGAVPHLLQRLDAPVFGSDYTIEVLRQRFAQRRTTVAPVLRRLPESPQTLRLGPFGVEAVAVAHSIPQCRLIAIETPAGLVVHSGDFKLDLSPPDGEGTDRRRLKQLGRRGVLALLSDSTNAECAGTTPGEAVAHAALDEVLRRATGRVVLTTFSSNIQRVAGLARLARAHGRRLAFLGAALHQHVEVAQQLDLLPCPPGVRIAADRLAELPREAVLAVAGGSQGERLSAMSRVAAGTHRDLALETGDTVIHSARIIPGNERPIGTMINRLLRRGVHVVTAADAPVHVSGHASAAELRRLIGWLRPRWFVPIHGEYRQLRAHAALAVDSGLDPGSVLLAENGQRIRVDPHSLAIVGRVDVGRTYAESDGVVVDPDLLRDRKKSANDGVVVAVVDIDGRTGRARGYPGVVTRGFTPGANDEAEMLERSRQAVREALAEAPAGERGDPRPLAARIERHLRRAIRRDTRRSPLVIAVVRHV